MVLKIRWTRLIWNTNNTLLHLIVRNKMEFAITTIQYCHGFSMLFSAFGLEYTIGSDSIACSRSITQEAETLASASWSQHSLTVLINFFIPECQFHSSLRRGRTLWLITRSCNISISDLGISQDLGIFKYL